jgi:hypothetical protein
MLMTQLYITWRLRDSRVAGQMARFHTRAATTSRPRRKDKKFSMGAKLIPPPITYCPR